MKPASAFCYSANAPCVCMCVCVCVCVSVTFSVVLSLIWCCLSKLSSNMSKAEAKMKHKCESKSCYRLCSSLPMLHHVQGFTQSVRGLLGGKHAKSALEGADCPHCERLPLRMLRSWKALFEEGAFASIPRGSLVGFAVGSGGGNGDELHSLSLSPSSPARACVRSLGSEALSAVSSPWGSGSGGGGEVSLVDPVRYEKEAAPSILSLTGTRRPSNRRWHFSVFSLAVL